MVFAHQKVVISKPLSRSAISTGRGQSVGFSFDIKNDARFAASNGGYDAIREKLFGKPRQHMGVRVKTGTTELTISPEGRPKKLLKRKPFRLDKPAPAAEQHD